MRKPNFDYSKTMMMKIAIGIPDNKGGCTLFETFASTLEKIKIIDNLTAGAPKIIYLVGWQYLGHDNKYPAFFEVNEHAKRAEDKTARDSLLWLIEEAKKYHTIVSLHINFSDAYPDSPLWQTYIDNNLILLNSRGKPKVTGTWNGNTAYQVRFEAEYKSGFFQKRVDQLLELLPLEAMHTVHVDAFFVRKGKDTTIVREKIYRKKMIEYLAEKGIDVTSEFIYREWKCGYRSHQGKSDMIGYIPAIWNLVMTQKDYLKYPPNVLAGGSLNMNLQIDKALQYLFYGNMQGEDVFPKPAFETEFLEKFATTSLCYFYLNHYKCEKITGIRSGRTAHFSENVTTKIASKMISSGNYIVKREETLCLPMHWRENEYFAYSNVPCKMAFPFKSKQIALYAVSLDGEVFVEEKTVTDGQAEVDFNRNSAYVIREV